MERGYFQSKQLTRDYHTFCPNPLRMLDVMAARRSWRKYREGKLSAALETQLKDFIKTSSNLRGCTEKELLLITAKKQLPGMFEAAYKGFSGKINPWLRKSGTAGLLAMAIDKRARHEERPTAYAFPSMVVQDTVLWLTEKGIGTVWLAGLNGDEMAKVLGLPFDQWVPAMIVFGETGRSPSGINLDNMMYKSISRKRKPLQEIVYRDRYGQAFDIPEILSERLQVNSSVSVTESLEYLSGWKKKKKARSPSQLEWEILAESARISPSAANKQQWKFILIQEETLLRDLRGLLKERRTLGGIIACIGMTSLPLLERGLERPFWMIDLPIAISSITLMAGALDFLARVYVDEIPEQQVNSLLQLESDWRTVGLVGLR